MPSELLKTIFQQNQVDFRCIDLFSSAGNFVADMSKQSQIDCAILSDNSDIFIALNPATHRFNLSLLNKVLGKKLSRVEKREAQELNANLLTGMSLNLKNNIHVFIDEALEYQDELYVVDDSAEQAYAIDIKQLQKLTNDELIGISFSEEVIINMDVKETLSFKERVKALHSLPPMPETAAQILNLRALKDVKVEQIVNVIEKDPVLVAQIVSYANSAFFGQAGSVKSLKDAIFRVLGVDAVMNMALALSVGSTFKIPQSGPVGSRAIWRSSIYSASLMQRLSMLMPWGERPNPGTAYLVGLLHDVGLLVLGHLFSHEYIELNEYLEKNKDVNLFKAEEQVFGINHIEVGKMVMRMWNMPEELIGVAAHINEKNYSGENEKYIQLLSVIKTILVPHGLAFGDSSEDLPLELLEKLCLDEEEVILAADEVLQEGEIIKELVKQMCA
ncbi:MAG: HDOD domain-containing protein [Gammaproteobacteria bacterium]|nr:HDOD domain-containing protein [Gammaproteobacteria bacterium]MCW8986246.1 HDOD domain-containing protein [Gammaproteobacteria bacterium]MCW9031167.1 HDOD domain-containing protein [Gammaproteobacteria bacterium]